MQPATVTGFYTLNESLQRIRGWLYNSAAPTQSRWVEILANQQVIAVLLANLERGDLRTLNTGYTRYGFDFLLPSGNARGSIDITVRDRATGTCLASKKQQFNTRSVSEKTIPVAPIEHINDNVIASFSDRVCIQSDHWHGDQQFIDQFIGFEDKTAQRVGSMRLTENGCWEYLKQIRYYRLRDALVIMPFGMVIADGCLLRSNLGFAHPHLLSPVIANADSQPVHNMKNWLQSAQRVRLRKVEDSANVIERPTLLLSAPQYRGYFHWHMDVLPILSQIDQLEQNSVQHIMTPGCPTAWHAESLQHALRRYPHIALTEFNELRILRVKELIYSTGLAGNGGYLSPKLTAFYNTISHACHEQQALAGVGRKLFLSRRAYPRRTLVNQQEIESTMIALGFQVIDPADYSYAQQMRLFQHADFIVAPHGAALTNLLFCRDGIKVIELHADCYLHLGLLRLANLKNAQYGYIVGASSGGSSDHHNHNFTYTIDAGLLASLVRDMGG